MSDRLRHQGFTRLNTSQSNVPTSRVVFIRVLNSLDMPVLAHHFFPSAFVPQRFTLMPRAAAMEAFVSRHSSADLALVA